MKLTKRQLRRIIRESLENSSLYDMFSGWDPAMIRQAIELNEFGGEFPQPVGVEENYNPPKPRMRNRRNQLHWVIRFEFEDRKATAEFENMVIAAELAISTKPGAIQSRVFGSITKGDYVMDRSCLLYTSPSPRDATLSRMPSSA